MSDASAADRTGHDCCCLRAHRVRWRRQPGAGAAARDEHPVPDGDRLRLPHPAGHARGCEAEDEGWRGCLYAPLRRDIELRERQRRPHATEVALQLGTCVTCTAITDGIAKIYAAGGKITGQGWTIVSTNRMDLHEAVAFVDATIQSSEQVVTLRPGPTPKNSPRIAGSFAHSCSNGRACEMGCLRTGPQRMRWLICLLLGAVPGYLLRCRRSQGLSKRFRRLLRHAPLAQLGREVHSRDLTARHLMDLSRTTAGITQTRGPEVQYAYRTTCSGGISNLRRAPPCLPCSTCPPGQTQYRLW